MVVIPLASLTNGVQTERVSAPFALQIDLLPRDNVKHDNVKHIPVNVKRDNVKHIPVTAWLHCDNLAATNIKMFGSFNVQLPFRVRSSKMPRSIETRALGIAQKLDGWDEK